MAKYVEFHKKLNEKVIMVSDGATGTNLQKRGLPVGKTSEAWMDFGCLRFKIIWRNRPPWFPG